MMTTQTDDPPFVDPSVPITTGNEIVAFSTVDAPLQETVPAPKAIDKRVVSNMMEGREHTILDILSREYAFYDGSIPIGGAPGDIINTWDVTSSFLAQPNVRDKLRGFAYFKASLAVRFEFSTLPTNQGGIMLSYYADLDPLILATRTTSIMKLGQVPNRQMSLTTAETLNIHTPWISPFYGRDLVGGYGSNGTIIMSRLTPSAGSTVSFRAYVSAIRDSIELNYPTTGDLVTTVQDQIDDIQERLTILKEMDPEAFKKMFPTTQNKKRRTGVVSEGHITESQPMEKGGAISGILGTGAKIATLASGIPVIGAAAAVAAPLLNIGAKLAGMFGFSKPCSDTPVQAIKWKPGDSHLTNEGVLPAHQFSINMNNLVSGSDVPFGSQADEMATEAIMNVPNIINTFTVTTSQTPRTVLAVHRLNLAQFNQIGPIGDNVIEVTHQMWLSQLVQMWLADLVFSFDVYLTHFHRVKLRFVVLPNVYPALTIGAPLPATFDINKATSAVVEFSGDNANYDLIIPPRSTTALKMTLSSGAGAAAAPSLATLIAGANTVQNSYGTLIVMVEVPLKASDSVATSVTFVTSFSAEKVNLTNPATGLMMIPNTQSKNTLGTDFEKQSRSERMIDATLGLISNSVNVDMEKNIEVAAGDRVIHLRNLMNAFSLFYDDLEVNGANNLTVLANVSRNRNGTGVPQDRIDLMDYLQCGYAFKKGSVNIRMSTNLTSGRFARVAFSTTNQFAATTLLNDGTGIANLTPCGAIRAGTRIIPVFAEEGAVDFSVPYYQQTHMVPYSGNNSGGRIYGRQSPAHLIMKLDSSQTLTFWRSAGDDFRMGFLLGLPNFYVMDTYPFKT